MDHRTYLVALNGFIIRLTFLENLDFLDEAKKVFGEGYGVEVSLMEFGNLSIQLTPINWTTE